MGLLTRLEQGSALSLNDGGTPSINPLSLQTSTLHSNGDVNTSFSLNGSNANIVGNQMALYEDGYANSPLLPLPSGLDLNGYAPNAPLSYPGVIPINNSFVGGQYLNNLPEGGTLIGDTNIATPFG
jgi:hypothetical protein